MFFKNANLATNLIKNGLYPIFYDCLHNMPFFNILFYRYKSNKNCLFFTYNSDIMPQSVAPCSFLTSNTCFTYVFY